MLAIKATAEEKEAKSNSELLKLESAKHLMTKRRSREKPIAVGTQGVCSFGFRRCMQDAEGW